MKRVKVSLELDKKSVLELVSFGFHVVAEMTDNSFFPAPHPALDVVYASTDALRIAEQKADGGGTNEKSVMRQKRELLEVYLTELGHYVEDVANDPSNILAGSETIISGAGMQVKRFSPRKKQEFSAMAGKLPGTADLTAPGTERGSHEWGYTPDLSNPNSWIDAGTTTRASVTISGLESAKRYWFRHRSILPDGPSVWDGPVELVVQ